MKKNTTKGIQKPKIPNIKEIKPIGNLTVGLCTVNTRNKNYLVDTIQSLITNLSGKSNTNIIIYWCDLERVKNDAIEIVKTQFNSSIQSNLLSIVRVDDHKKFNLETTNSSNFVEWRTKQNCDFSEAFRLSKKCDFYLHTEDDVIACKNYDSYVFAEIQRNPPGTTIRLGGGGFIGWLFWKYNLEKMSQLLIKHKDTMPCDWIAERKWEGPIIYTKYSIFQHIGLERSHTGNIQPVVFSNFIK